MRRLLHGVLAFVIAGAAIGCDSNQTPPRSYTNVSLDQPSSGPAQKTPPKKGGAGNKQIRSFTIP
jgi:hypothetical protein